MGKASVAGSAISEASSTSVPGSMRSSLSSFMRSPVSLYNSMMPSPVSSTRLTMEFEARAFLMEAEDPVRFSSTDNILPYLSSQASSRSASSSEFDTQTSSDECTGASSTSTSSFCDFDNDSNRITLASLIGLPMDSFRHFGESFRFQLRAGGGSDHSTSARLICADNDSSPRRSRTCSLLGNLLRCLAQRTTSRTDYVPSPATLTSLTSFTITEVSEADERNDHAHPTVFDNSVFVDRETLGSRIYEFNPLFISDAMSEADPTESSRDLSLARSLGALASGDHSDIRAKYYDIITNYSTDRPVESPRLSVQVRSSPSPAICQSSQPVSPMRTVLTTVCCQLGDDSDEYTSDHHEY